MVDREVEVVSLENRLKINVLSGLLWSFEVFQNGAQERT